VLPALVGCSSDPSSALVLRPGSTPAPVAATQADPIERPHYHYFGEVRLGEVVEHTFTFDNPTGRSVAIERAIPSCGCLALVVEAFDAAGEAIEVQDWRTTDMAVVPPDGRLEVTFRVDSTRVPVPNQSRLVQADVKTDDPVQELIRLEATVVAVSPFVAAYPVTQRLDFGTVDATGESTERLKISQAGPRSEELTGEVLEQPEDWKVLLWEEPVIGETRTWTLQVTVPPGESGAFEGRVLLGTALVESGAPSEPRVERVAGIRADPVFANPPRVFFRGDDDEKEVRVASRTRVAGAAIERVEVTGTLATGLDVNVLDGARVSGPGNNWTLTMKLPSEAPAEASGTVVVHFRSGLWPPVEIPYSKLP